MWINKLLKTLKRELAPTRKEETHQKSKRLLCMEQLRSLDLDRFTQYRPEQGLGYQVTPLYSDIELYTRKLKDASYMVKENEAVPPTWLPVERKAVVLDHFLTSSDGFYLDIQVAVENFKTAAVHLCEATEAADYVTHGTAEHNVRMLRSLFIDVTIIAATLEEASKVGD